MDINFQKFERVRTDYLRTTWGIPLFSRHFIDDAPTGFLDEVQVIPAELHLRGGRSSYFAVRTRKYLNLVNADASKFSNIRGIKILTKASFDTSAGDFHVARDTQFRRVFVASQRMIEAIKDQQFRIEYLPY